MNAPNDKASRPPSIEIHIERLVVDGLAVRNADHLSLVVQNELQSLLAANGLGHFAQSTKTGTSHQLSILRTAAIHTSRAPHASDAGEKIARAIHGGLRS